MDSVLDFDFKLNLVHKEVELIGNSLLRCAFFKSNKIVWFTLLLQLQLDFVLFYTVFSFGK